MNVSFITFWCFNCMLVNWKWNAKVQLKCSDLNLKLLFLSAKYSMYMYYAAFIITLFLTNLCHLLCTVISISKKNLLQSLKQRTLSSNFPGLIVSRVFKILDFNVLNTNLDRWHKLVKCWAFRFGRERVGGQERNLLCYMLDGIGMFLFFVVFLIMQLFPLFDSRHIFLNFIVHLVNLLLQMACSECFLYYFLVFLAVILCQLKMKFCLKIKFHLMQ